MSRSIAIFLLLVIANHAFASPDYCDLKSVDCDGDQHTMCRYKGETSLACHTVISANLTVNEKTRIVDYHNFLRQTVAKGEERRGRPGPQPSATNMTNLEWDNELAEIAQRWANQCEYKHDRCRHIERFRVGQNLALIGITGPVSLIQVEDLIDDWYNEVKHFNRNCVHRFTSIYSGNTARIGYYTQLVWAKTTKIGCGAVKYKRRLFNYFYLVCNYGPAGNVFREPIYKTNSSSPYEYIFNNLLDITD